LLVRLGEMQCKVVQLDTNFIPIGRFEKPDKGLQVFRCYCSHDKTPIRSAVIVTNSQLVQQKTPKVSLTVSAQLSEHIVGPFWLLINEHIVVFAEMLSCACAYHSSCLDNVNVLGFKRISPMRYSSPPARIAQGLTLAQVWRVEDRRMAYLFN